MVVEGGGPGQGFLVSSEVPVQLAPASGAGDASTMSADETTWNQLSEMRPDLAQAGRGLLYQYGVGLAFLATVRSDGGPRLHPMCPLINEHGLFAFIVPSPKRDDLLRDGRFALHSFPADDNEDAFYIAGRTREVADQGLRTALEDQFIGERKSLSLDRLSLSDHVLFEFLPSTCLLTRTTGHGDDRPVHDVWHASS